MYNMFLYDPLLNRLISKALKYFKRSYRLDPSETTKSYIDKCEILQKNPPSESSASTTAATPESSTSNSNVKANARNFTKEQVNILSLQLAN